MSEVKSFLIVFDHARNELISCDQFGTDSSAATAAYSAKESYYRDSDSVDIVLVGSDSLETVKITHSTYFKDGARDLVARALSSVIPA